MHLHRYNYGKDSYDLGSGFGHFALAVPDVYKTVDSIKSAGAGLTRPAHAGCHLSMSKRACYGLWTMHECSNEGCACSSAGPQTVWVQQCSTFILA